MTSTIGHEAGITEIEPDVTPEHTAMDSMHETTGNETTGSDPAPMRIQIIAAVRGSCVQNMPIEIHTPHLAFTISGDGTVTSNMKIVDCETAAITSGGPIPIYFGTIQPTQQAPHVRIILTNVLITDDPQIAFNATIQAVDVTDLENTDDVKVFIAGAATSNPLVTLPMNGAAQSFAFDSPWNFSATTSGNIPLPVRLYPGQWEIPLVENEVQIMLQEWNLTEC